MYNTKVLCVLLPDHYKKTPITRRIYKARRVQTFADINIRGAKA